MPNVYHTLSKLVVIRKRPSLKRSAVRHVIAVGSRTQDKKGEAQWNTESWPGS